MHQVTVASPSSMKKQLLLVLSLSACLAACDEGQEKSLAECKFSALQTYKSGRPEHLDEWGPYYHYLSTCMKTKGFTENATPRLCQATDYDLTWGIHYCYEPDDFLSNLVWRIRVTFQGGWD